MGSTTDRIKRLFSGQQAVHKIPTPLQAYLNRAYADVQKEDERRRLAHETRWLNPDLGPGKHDMTLIPIAIFLRGNGAFNHHYAAKFGEREHYSGSLIKVAAMFAAYQLRKDARDLLADLKTKNIPIANQEAFFAKLKGPLAVTLADAVPEIRDDPHITILEPVLDAILSVTGFPTLANLTVDLNANFRGEMRKMIVDSKNCSAAECIGRLSYRYINVALKNEVAFTRIQDATSGEITIKGIWLAGDFKPRPEDEPNEPPCLSIGQAFVRIKTENDCKDGNCLAAQNTTARKMATLLFKLIPPNHLVDDDSSQEMRDLLRDAEGESSSFLGRSAATKKFTIEGAKIGLGRLKELRPPGILVIRSEGLLIKLQDPSDPKFEQKRQDMGLTGDAAICYQNVNNRLSDHDGNVIAPGVASRGIIEIINQTIVNFVNQNKL